MRRRVTMMLAVAMIAAPAALTRAQSERSSPPAAEMDKVHVDVFQRRMVADPTMMEKIRALQDDPVFEDVLADPEIADAISAGDTTALMANPKVSALVDHPTVRELTNRLGE